MRKYVFIIFFLTFCFSYIFTGCKGREKSDNKQIDVKDSTSTEDIVENANEVKKVQNKEFPEKFQATYEKLHFDADVIIDKEADINNLYRFCGKRLSYDIQKAYEKLVGEEFFEKTYEGEGIGDEGKAILNEAYEGTNKEKLYMNRETLTFLTPLSNYILKCVHTDSKDPRYNIDKYKLNGELEFVSKEKGYKEILSLLSDIGFMTGDDFQTVIYALDYQTLEQEEYAIKIDGTEDVSIYKDSWNKEDDCYYYFLRQKMDGLPLYYVYGNVIKELDICNTPVQVIYSKDGIERLDIDKLFKMDVTVSKTPVSLLSLEDLSQLMENQYEMLISDDIFEIHKMELYMMAQKNIHNTYDIFPVWIMSLEQTRSEDGSSKHFQCIIDAETGVIIS